MKLLPVILTVVTAVTAVVHLASVPDLVTQSLPTSRISYPDDKATGVVVLLSDSHGWSAEEQKVSDALTSDGAMVVGVDLPSYYAALNEQAGDCLYLVSDIEDLSRQLHRRLDIANYRPPIIAGIGDGATLALAIAAQTPNSTISETMAVDPEAVIPLSTVLCTPAAKKSVLGGIVYGLTSGDLPNPVQVVFSPGSDASGRSHAEDLRQAHPDIEIHDAAGNADVALQDYLSAAYKQITHSSSVLDLPIVPIETSPKLDTMAVIYSGDGGWRDIDQKLAAYLKEDGIPVVGVDSLRYFWSDKTPEQTAADLSRIIATYRQKWKVGHVVLIGYSFGANILPATYRALPEADKQAVSMLSLLSPSHQADFEVAVTGWLGFDGAASHGDPVDDLQAIEPFKIQCIYGVAEQDDSACPDLAERPDVQILSRKGGHHFDGDYRALEKLIVERAAAFPAASPELF